MPLPFTVDSLDGLDDSVKALYSEKKDGGFQLAIEGLPDFGELQAGIDALKAKNNELLGEKKQASEKARLAEEAARKEAEEAAKKSGDVDAITKSYEEKIERIKQELIDKYEPDLQLKDKLLQNATVNATANQIANEIGVPGSAKALLPHLTQRLKMEVKDGEAVTVVTGLDGKPSALSVDELKNEFKSDAAFAPLIIGSKATGGGANGSNGGAGNNAITRAEFDAKSDTEKSAFFADGGSVTD